MRTKNDPYATAWQCTTCGKRPSVIKYDDDGRQYLDCDCTKQARSNAKTKCADTFPHDSPTTLVDANGMSEDDNEQAL